MGMFDYIRCEMPLPTEQDLSSCGVFQTKDTPNQYLDMYIIGHDGKLWLKEYDSEKIISDNYTGIINFYSYLDDENHEGWIEFKAKLFDGEVITLELVKLDPIKDVATPHKT